MIIHMIVLHQDVVDNVTDQNTCMIKTALLESLFIVKMSIVLDKPLVNGIIQQKIIKCKIFKLLNLLPQTHNHLNFFIFIFASIFAFC